MNEQIREVILAAKDLLKGGDHEGSCTVGPMGECEIHWERSSERRTRLMTALKPFDNVEVA